MKIEQQALAALRLALEEAPGLTVLDVQDEANAGQGPARGSTMRVALNNQHYTLLGCVNSSGQPRQVLTALLRLREQLNARQSVAFPVFVAPYLSPDARDLCNKNQVSYLDLEGNARIVFPGFFMLRSVASKPVSERRELRSLFKPKSAAVLRSLLRSPARCWRVTELASASMVSVGHVSNVCSNLLDRGWAERSDRGLFLVHPDGLLDAWRESYAPIAGARQSFYTPMHGDAFDAALRVHGTALALDGLAILASFSAANWLAPYARTGTHFFYADQEGVERLRQCLNLSSAAKGENVVITVFDDLALFNDSVEVAPGIYCTSPVQTYLDLYVSGERAREAAEYLRQERLQWQQ